VPCRRTEGAARSGLGRGGELGSRALDLEVVSLGQFSRGAKYDGSTFLC
jgi:hypothetical protein